VAYDVLAESVALIEAGRAEPVSRLSRRRRFAAMAVDVDGDAAATMFARRGVGRICKEINVLALREGEWTWLGGGGGDDDQDLLADRPAVLPTYLGLGVQGVDPRVMASNWRGGSSDGGDGTGPSPPRWISYAEVRVNAEVTSVRVADRLLVVPWHGRVIVVWSGLPPHVVALDETGKSRAEMQLASTR
jgi:hypothetical protein